MGITEETDAIALIVSEETGALSLCFRGKLEHDLEPAVLKDLVNDILIHGSPQNADERDEQTRELGKGI